MVWIGFILTLIGNALTLAFTSVDFLKALIAKQVSIPKKETGRPNRITTVKQKWKKYQLTFLPPLLQPPKPHLKSAMINHYEVLGLPSNATSHKLTQNDITKAYRSKALELHPDKCPNDPEASTKFQNLKSSYEILINPNTRKIVDKNLSQTDEDRRRKSEAEDRANTFMKWMEYERMKDAFMWKLVSKNT